MGAMTQTPQEQLAADGAATFTARDYRPGLVRHVVLFRYRDDVTDQQKGDVQRRFRDLAASVRDDGARYILSVDAGSQRSGEGAGAGFEDGFVVSFASEGDRNYYVGTPVVDNPAHYDPAHAAFKKFVGPLLAESGGALVFDIIPPV
jgi:hypothetical protein